MWTISKKYPFVRAVWVAVVVLMTFSLARQYGFGLGVQEPAVFILSVGVLLFVSWDAILRLQKLEKKWPVFSTTFSAAYVILAYLVVTCLATSYLLGWPVDWKPRSEDQYIELPFRLHTLKFDVEPISGSPNWIYRPGQVDDQQAAWRTTMGKWVQWASQGAPNGRNVQLVQASWTGGFPGRHHFNATLGRGQVDKGLYNILEGILFVVNNEDTSGTTVVFRQYPFKINESNISGDLTCEIKDTRRSEKLYVLLLIEPKKNEPVDPKNINLWLQKQ